MKLTATIEMESKEVVSEVLRAFFAEVNPENTIQIASKDEEPAVKNATIEWYGDTISKSLIDAICNANIVELQYQKQCKDVEEKQEQSASAEENVQEEIIADQQPVQELMQELVQENAREPDDTDETTVGEHHTVPQLKEVHALEDIPELKCIMEKATSREETMQSVTTWLRIVSQRELFWRILEVSMHMEHISWNNVQAEFQKRGWEYDANKKTYCSHCITDKMREAGYAITILPLVKMIAAELALKPEAVKEMDTLEKTLEENLQTEELPTVNVKEQSEEDEKTEPLMQEKIGKDEQQEILIEDTPDRTGLYKPIFLKAIQNVDFTQSVDTRVKNVLNTCGVNKMRIRDKTFVKDIAIVAVQLPKITNEKVMAKAKVPAVDEIKARMAVSTFVNVDLKEDNVSNIKAEDFLKDLQDFILTHEEKEQLRNQHI